MKKRSSQLLLLLLLTTATGHTQAHVQSQACGSAGTALQVLGSGGPVADDERASSGYLLWHNGKSLALIDAGGGVFQRFAAAGGSFEQLEIIALTHFHTDHSADLPALLKSSYFSSRRRSLAIAGPDGRGVWPSLETFLGRLFGRETGAYGYLHGLVDGDDSDLLTLRPVTVPADTGVPFKVFKGAGLTVSAVGVHHGPVPTLGFLLEIDGYRVAISGDQNLSTPHFLNLSRGADVVVLPLAIGERAEPIGLHARPSDIARAVADLNAKRLLLSHWMARSLRQQSAHVERIGKAFGGQVIVAEDGLCIPLR